ncbi:MAG: T9SS type A sorting domain-containing protein [Hymenobacter sp.]|nr:MAG: T9SS type A sorting domain-containing protein [Hymenobacter sp.]
MLTTSPNRLLHTGLCLSLTLLVISGAHAQTITWTGAVDTVYTNPRNWNPMRSPNRTDDVLIPNTTNKPSLSPALGIGTAGNLTIAPNARLKLNGSGELDLFGNLVNNGTFGGDGILSIRALPTATTPVMHTISGSGSAISIRDMELLALAPATLQTAVLLSRQLTLNADLMTATTGGTLTLLSTPPSLTNPNNPGATAFVVNNGTFVVNGPVTVQRAIDGANNPATGTNPLRLGYRHYSSPVSGNTVNDFATTTFSPVFNTSYNESSFAPGTRTFPTVFLYDQARVVTDNGYSPNNGFSTFDRGWAVPASGAPMLVGRGYTVNLGSTELVDFVGTLNNGDRPTAVLLRNAAGTPAADLAGFHLLGNPYPAPIDYSRVVATDRTGLDNAMYVYTSTSQYGGFYRAYQFNGNNADGTVNTTNTIGNPVVPLGQAFFVHVTTPGTTGTFTFRNAQRLTTSDGTTFQRPIASVRPQLEMALHSSDKVVQDMLNVYFADGSTTGADSKYDAVKMPNKNGMFLGTLTADGQELAVDGRPMPTDKLTIPLHVAVSASGAYTIETTQLANMGDLHVYMHDIRLGSFTDLSQQPEYTFNLNSVSSAPRFELVFSKQPITEVAPAALTQQVSLYPSPAKGVAFLELPTTLSNEAIKTTLVDALGRTVRTASLAAEGEATHQIDLQGLRSGIYVLQLHTSAGIVAKRLVVE